MATTYQAFELDPEGLLPSGNTKPLPGEQKPVVARKISLPSTAPAVILVRADCDDKLGAIRRAFMVAERGLAREALMSRTAQDQARRIESDKDLAARDAAEKAHQEALLKSARDMQRPRPVGE